MVYSVKRLCSLVSLNSVRFYWWCVWFIFGNIVSGLFRYHSPRVSEIYIVGRKSFWVGVRRLVLFFCFPVLILGFLLDNGGGVFRRWLRLRSRARILLHRLWACRWRFVSFSRRFREAQLTKTREWHVWICSVRCNKALGSCNYKIIWSEFIFRIQFASC